MAHSLRLCCAQRLLSSSRAILQPASPPSQQLSQQGQAISGVRLALPHAQQPVARWSSRSAVSVRASSGSSVMEAESGSSANGVIWKGDKLIDGVPETLDMLRAMGKRLVFVTNNSTKSRKQYGKKFESLGLTVTEEEIFASSFAAAAYLTSINFPADKKVYVVGEQGIQLELDLAGVNHIGGPVGAVVVGFDRYVNYYKLQEESPPWHPLIHLFPPSPCLHSLFPPSRQLLRLPTSWYATLCLRENPGCLFIATNCDAVTHLTDAQEWAGGGTMVGAIKGSTKKEPVVVGKPSTFMMDYLASKREPVVVGKPSTFVMDYLASKREPVVVGKPSTFVMDYLASKREPVVVGKPSTFMMDYLASKFGIAKNQICIVRGHHLHRNVGVTLFHTTPSPPVLPLRLTPGHPQIRHGFGIAKNQICMVGDRLDTDILFGQNGDCRTLLVLSGETAARCWCSQVRLPHAAGALSPTAPPTAPAVPMLFDTVPVFYPIPLHAFFFYLCIPRQHVFPLPCNSLPAAPGVTTLETLNSPDNTIRPDFYTSQISDLLSAAE
ncbi:unnamed protein product [Closterium sp. NIES-64]|nr:unnamed protein product [Closterium sp. NIES-64]